MVVVKERWQSGGEKDKREIMEKESGWSMEGVEGNWWTVRWNGLVDWVVVGDVELQQKILSFH